MPDLRRRLTVLLACLLFGLGCTTGFELRSRAADGGPAADAASDASAAPDADGGVAADAGVCRAAGDRCCADAVRGAFCVGGLVCSEGYCAPCPGGLFACGNACIDLQTSGRHCGVCGAVCPEGQRCVGGSCALDCPPPGSVCSGRCVNAQSDDANCGACGRSCAAAAGQNGIGRCVAGACQRACAPGFADCDGAAANGCEVDVRASVAHCGACGVACAPPRATGACAAGQCGVARCTQGFGDCDGVAGNGCEVDVQRDTAHCGACGGACPVGQVCRDGLCLATMTLCQPGTADCRADALGCETPTDRDPSNCGGCGRTCAFPNAAASCGSSMCRLGSCASGFDNCDGSAGNGCEVRVATDLAHCGACNRACVTPHAQPACAAGACAIAACDAGYADCDGAASNGCEVDLTTSATHCGACAAACAPANAEGACVAGRCAVGRCRAGYADCDGSASNGCEVNLAVDPVNCGTCASVCAFPNAAASCASGACALGACRPGFRDCDGAASNGCEADLGSIATCGDCRRACGFPNAAASCAAGACALGACSPGWGNCDGDPANGCEAALSSSAAHCGGCGRRCATGQICSGGVCALSCASHEMVCAGACVDLNTNVSHCRACDNACAAEANEVAVCAEGECRRRCVEPYGDCDGRPGNGCEAFLNRDLANCGRCGVGCASPPNATGVCERGTCLFNCATGFRDCDGDPANGCEAAIGTDPNNCGGCGVVCPGGINSDRLHIARSSCSAGACAITCADHWADCNQVIADGCEVNLGTTSNCGTCGRVCGRDGVVFACCLRPTGYRCCVGRILGEDICGGGLLNNLCS